MTRSLPLWNNMTHASFENVMHFLLQLDKKINTKRMSLDILDPEPIGDQFRLDQHEDWKHVDNSLRLRKYLIIILNTLNIKYLYVTLN